jgi:hypothetical protein
VLVSYGANAGKKGRKRKGENKKRGVQEVKEMNFSGLSK